MTFAIVSPAVKLVRHIGQCTICGMKGRGWKILALIFALIPAGLLLTLAIGEGFSGFGHYAQLVPILLLSWLGWDTPRPAGFVLVFSSIALMIMYAISTYEGTPLSTLAVVELILFFPLFLSGLSWLRAEYVSRAR